MRPSWQGIVSWHGFDRPGSGWHSHEMICAAAEAACAAVSGPCCREKCALAKPAGRCMLFLAVNLGLAEQAQPLFTRSQVVPAAQPQLGTAGLVISRPTQGVSSGRGDGKHLAQRGGRRIGMHA